MSEHVTDLREMQAKVNEMCARMAALQRHYGYTWIGNLESGEWRLRLEGQEVPGDRVGGKGWA